MSLAPGNRIGGYEISALIGSGGMGEVYRARDPRLKRDVAIKVLPDAFTSDPERLARLQREAEVLASLNHPNIGQIHGLEERALVLELVEGPTLADRITRGPIPLDEALPIARQIAEALEAAHDRGIVHRDLKPANIKTTLDGTVKVLDFGLAKAMDGSADGRTGRSTKQDPAYVLSQSPTMTSPVMSGIGVILGTAAYMSPEQARGKPVDKRADIWAFGCVLFEMITGAQTFSANDVSDLMVSILRDEPRWSLIPPSCPPAIRELMKRCLEKDPRLRLRDIGEARILLERKSEPAPLSPSKTVTRRFATAAVCLVSAALGIGAGILLESGRTPVVPTSPVRFVVPPPPGWMFESGPPDQGGLPVAISPDGRQIAMVARSAEGRNMLWVRPLDSASPVMLAGTEGASSPFWSGDGQAIGFFADGQLRRIAATGGPAVTVCPALNNRNGTWNRHGVILFSPDNRSAVMRVAASGGDPVPITRLEDGELGHIRPVFLPGGHHFLYASYAAGQVSDVPIYLASLDGMERKLVVRSDTAHVGYGAGHVLFMRESALMAQLFDERALEVVGDPWPVAENIQTELTPGFAVFSASENGALIYQTLLTGEGITRLVSLDRSGRVVAEHGQSGNYFDIDLSDDGARIALVAIDRGQRTRDIFLHEVAGNRRSRFTFDPMSDEGPVWAPGKEPSHLLFRRRHDSFSIYRKASNGSGSEELVLERATARSVSPDGRHVLISHGDGRSGDLFTLDMSKGGTPVPYTKTPAVEFTGQFSPDGRWIAYQANETGLDEIFIAPFPPTGAKWLVSTAGGIAPRWRADGEELYYLDRRNRLMAAPIDIKGSAAKVGDVIPLFTTRPRLINNPYDVFPDGQRFLFNMLNSDVSPEPISVVLNWTGLKK